LEPPMISLFLMQKVISLSIWITNPQN